MSDIVSRVVPRKDGIYAISLSNIGTVLPGEGEFVVEDNYSDNLITGEDIKNVYTLVRYKGNGLFEEYYSRENAIMIFNYYQNDDEPVEGVLLYFSDNNMLTYNSDAQKNAKKEFYKKVPLSVDPKNLIPVSSEIIFAINNSNYGDAIRTYITALKEYAIEEIKASYDAPSRW